MFLQTNAKIVHMLIVPIPMYGRKSWTVKMGDRKKMIHLKHSVKEELYRNSEPPDEQVSPRAN